MPCGRLLDQSLLFCDNLDHAYELVHSRPANDSPACAPEATWRSSAKCCAVPLIDGHNDLPWQFHKQHNDLTTVDLRQGSHQLPQPWATDIPAAGRRGGAQFWAVYVPPELRRGREMTLEQTDLVHRLVKYYPDTFELARTADDIERIHRVGRIASLIGVEGGHSLATRWRCCECCMNWARYLTLTHTKTRHCRRSQDQPEHGGSPVGGGHGARVEPRA